jgi:hypothetical protein
MELAEKLVKKAATECSVCNEALTDVIEKRIARGESVREVCRDIAQAITLQAGGQLFSPDTLKRRFDYHTKKKLEQNVPAGGRPPKYQKNQEKPLGAGDDGGANEDAFLKCNLNSANEDPSTMTEREINAKKVIHKAEIAVEIQDDTIRRNMIREVLAMAKEVPQLDLADEVNEAIDTAAYAINLAIKVNQLLEVVSPEMVVDKVKRLFNNANGNSYESA